MEFFGGKEGKSVCEIEPGLRTENAERAGASAVFLGCAGIEHQA